MAQRPTKNRLNRNIGALERVGEFDRFMASKTSIKSGRASIFQAVKQFVLDVAAKFSEDNVPRLASSFSFYALLSVAPFLVLAVSVAAIILGRGTAEKELLAQAHMVGGKNLSDFLEGAIASSRKTSNSIVATILSLVVSFYSASNLFLQLTDSVNAIWKVEQNEPFIKNLILSRIVSFVSVFMFGSILVSWLVLDSVVAFISKESGAHGSYQVASFLVATLFLTLSFSVTFRAFPRGKLSFTDVWPGAFAAGCGVSASKLILSIYFAKMSGVYGAAGAVIVLLLWIYYAAMIYFLGIEITHVYAHRYGSLKKAE